MASRRSGIRFSDYTNELARATADLPIGDDGEPIKDFNYYSTLMLKDGKLTDAAFEEENIQYMPAVLARAQWDDYNARFVDFEDQLLQQTHYENPGIVKETIDKAMPGVESAINIGRGTQQRRLSALGQTVGAPAQQRIDRGWAREASKARVDAANRIRQNIAQRSEEIAFGGTSGGAINTIGGF